MGHRHIQSIRTKIKLSNNFQPSITRAKFHRNPSSDLRDKTLRADGRTEGKRLKYEGQSNENLKSAIRTQTTARLSCKFQQ